MKLRSRNTRKTRKTRSRSFRIERQKPYNPTQLSIVTLASPKNPSSLTAILAQSPESAILPEYLPHCPLSLAPPTYEQAQQVQLTDWGSDFTPRPSAQRISNESGVSPSAPTGSLANTVIIANSPSPSSTPSQMSQSRLTLSPPHPTRKPPPPPMLSKPVIRTIANPAPQKCPDSYHVEDDNNSNEQDDPSIINHPSEPCQMSGALAIDKIPPQCNFHTHTPASIPDLVDRQPFLILTLWSLIPLLHPYLEEAEMLENILPSGFLTTVLGVRLALEEMERTNSNSGTWETAEFAEALHCYGGWARKQRADGEWVNVIYPEDIQPRYEYIDDVNKAYWIAIWAQGNCWREWGMEGDRYEEMGEAGD